MADQELKDNAHQKLMRNGRYISCEKSRRGLYVFRSTVNLAETPEIIPPVSAETYWRWNMRMNSFADLLEIAVVFLSLPLVV